MTSESFYTRLHKLKDGEIIAQRYWVRFCMSHIGTGSQYKGSGDEAYRISLEIRNSDCSWSNAKLVVIGNAHFSSMVPIYEAAEWDNFVDNNKITVKQRGKHILDLMCKPENKVKEIEKACLSFDLCKLEYKNDVLSSVNSRGERKPLFHRVVGEYTSIFEVQFNEEAKILLNEYDKVLKRCTKLLQESRDESLKNRKEQLYLPPKQKEHTDRYVINDSIDFMAKQTVRWGNPVFTDTTEKQSVTFDVIKQQLQVGIKYWDSLSDLQKKDALRNINISQPNDLFNPKLMGLAGSITEPPQPTWFRIIEAFYKAVGICLTYTDCQEPTTIEPVDDAPQEVTEPIDTPLTYNSVLNGQSVLTPDSIDLLSEELASTSFFDDIDDRDRIERYIVWRRGQPEFRQKLLDAYGCCVITGCISEKALEAAHIKPYSDTKNNDPKNGLLLRADIHTLFDRHLIGIDPETMTVYVAQSLLEDYGQFNGKSLQLPEDNRLRPDKYALKIRYEEYKKRLDGYDQ